MIKVQESVNEKVLYHYTTIGPLFQILKDNTLKIGDMDEGEYNGVCFTRNKYFHRVFNPYDEIGVRFVVDKEKLSHNYKIQPHNAFFYSDDELADDLESEERIVGRDIKNFRRYIIRIEFIYHLFHVPEDPSNEVLEFLQACGRGVNRERVSTREIMDYIDSKYGIDCTIIAP